MKRKIGKLFNKTIIEGDINLKTPNEIHKNELNKGGGEKSKWICYLTNEDSNQINKYRTYAEVLGNDTSRDGAVYNLTHIASNGFVLAKKNTTLSYSGTFRGQAIAIGAKINTWDGVVIINSFDDIMRAIASLSGGPVDTIKLCFTEVSLDELIMKLEL